MLHVPLPVAQRESENTLRREQAEIVREAAIATLQPDIVHVSSLFEGFADNAVGTINQHCRVPTMVTLYDMIPLMNPKLYLDRIRAIASSITGSWSSCRGPMRW